MKPDPGVASLFANSIAIPEPALILFVLSTLNATCVVVDAVFYDSIYNVGVVS